MTLDRLRFIQLSGLIIVQSSEISCIYHTITHAHKKKSQSCCYLSEYTSEAQLKQVVIQPNWFFFLYVGIHVTAKQGHCKLATKIYNWQANDVGQTSIYVESRLSLPKCHSKRRIHEQRFYEPSLNNTVLGIKLNHQKIALLLIHRQILKFTSKYIQT